MAHEDRAKSVHMACEDAMRVPTTGVLMIMHQNKVRYGWNGHKFEAWFEMDLCCIAQAQVVRRHATVMCSRRRDHLAADAQKHSPSKMSMPASNPAFEGKEGSCGRGAVRFLGPTAPLCMREGGGSEIFQGPQLTNLLKEKKIPADIPFVTSRSV